MHVSWWGNDLKGFSQGTKLIPLLIFILFFYLYFDTRSNEKRNYSAVLLTNYHHHHHQGVTVIVIVFTLRVDAPSSSLFFLHLVIFNHRIQGNGLCDKRKRLCKKTTVQGRDFLNSANMTCHIREIKVQLHLAFVVIDSSKHCSFPS